MRKTCILAVMLLSLAGLVACVEDAVPTGGPGPTLTDADRADCTDHGGTVVTGFAGPTCAKATPDAGKSCKKASDCSGSCMTDTMTCSKITPQFGCYEVVMEDGQKAGLCVD